MAMDPSKNRVSKKILSICTILSSSIKKPYTLQIPKFWTSLSGVLPGNGGVYDKDRV